VPDKIKKNLFGSQQVYEFIRPIATVGVVARHPEKKIVEIAEPFGVVAAIVPSTNPTSTAIYKILISIKARCAIVLTPHPSAARCILRTAEIMYDAGRNAGLPDGAIGCMTTVTLEGTQELMRQREVAVILATGGMGLVRAAYSAGKPAYGVGPGNAPCYIEQSADVAKAASDIILGKAFDNGVLCSSPNSVVVDRAIDGEARRQFQAHGGHFLSTAETEALTRILITAQRLPNPALVGKSAGHIAEKAGIAVPPGTRVLIAELRGVGRDFPLSIEKLCPVLSYYVVEDWREGCERCKEILRYGGMGHTMSIHSRNEQIVLEFGLKKPAYRICVNTIGPAIGDQTTDLGRQHAGLAEPTGRSQVQQPFVGDAAPEEERQTRRELQIGDPAGGSRPGASRITLDAIEEQRARQDARQSRPNSLVERVATLPGRRVERQRRLHIVGGDRPSERAAGQRGQDAVGTGSLARPARRPAHEHALATRRRADAGDVVGPFDADRLQLREATGHVDLLAVAQGRLPHVLRL
jgi:acyl-CoA reductase-like NAD-dependent aldehyde dehydrogenase